MIDFRILSLMLFVGKWALAMDKQIIHGSSVDGMGPKMTLLKGKEFRKMEPCDVLHSAFEIDPILQCVERVQTSSDRYGSVSKLTQTKDGVRLECADIRVNHNFQRGETVISGEFYLRAPPSSRPTYSSGDAVELALEVFSQSMGLASGEVDFKLMKYIDTSPSSLFSCPSSLRLDEMRLSYKVDLNHEYYLNRSSVYIDAHSGATIKVVSNVREVSEAAGLTLTGYYGSKEVTVSQSNDGLTYYAMQFQNRNISVFNCVADDSCPIVANTNNLNFGTIERDQDQLMAAYWGMERTYDFYIQVFNRTGYDNNGTAIEILGTKLNNSFWSSGEPTQASFGFLTAFDLSTLDIVAHQFTHGVVDSEAGLVYENEPGTIAESICDCMGIYAHARTMFLQDYWIIGSETRLFSRSSQNPKQFGQPDTYKGEFWYNGTEDHGGIHQNNGVLNKMFYFLSSGGAGVNDQGNEYNVTGISIANATQIIYRATTNYLTRSSNFSDYRNAISQSALDLYSEYAQEQANNAFYAVGIGQKPRMTSDTSGGSVIVASFGSMMSPVSIWMTGLLVWVLVRHF